MSSLKALISMSMMIVLATACSQTEQLSEMHDSTDSMKNTTAKMSDTTSNMNQTTQELARKTEEMKNTTNELYDALRQGNSVQLRREAWKALLNAPTGFRKISEASKYFMSFEVQLWNQFAQDGSDEKRDVLSEQATQEFFLEIEELAPRDGIVDVTAMPKTSDIDSAENRQASFNAVVIAMDQINRKQLDTLKANKNARRISMFSLMEEALLAKSSIEDGTAKLGTREGYIKQVLAHEGKAIQILQTRYSMFPMMFIDAITAISDKNIVEKAKMATLGWELDFNKLNTMQMKYYQQEILDPALHAKELLAKLNVKTELDSTVKMLLKKMKVVAKVAPSADVAAMQTNILGSLQELQK